MSASCEPADVVAVVDVARRRADEDELREPLRLLDRGQHADHRRDRVADEDDVVQVELATDVEDVVARSPAATRAGRGRTPTGRTVRHRRGRTARPGSRPRRPARRAATCSGRSRTRARTASAGPVGRPRTTTLCRATTSILRSLLRQGEEGSMTGGTSPGDAGAGSLEGEGEPGNTVGLQHDSRYSKCIGVGRRSGPGRPRTQHRAAPLPTRRRSLQGTPTGPGH